MKIFRFISNFLIRDVYEIAWGGAAHQGWIYRRPRQTIYSLIHKTEEIYIYKSLLFLLAVFLTFMIKLKIGYKQQKKNLIITIKKQVEIESNELNTCIEKLNSNFSKKMKNSGLVHKNLYTEIIDNKKIVSNNKEKWLVEKIDIYSDDFYSEFSNIENYLCKLLNNYSNFFLLFSIIFLLLIFYKIIINSYIHFKYYRKRGLIKYFIKYKKIFKKSR